MASSKDSELRVQEELPEVLVADTTQEYDKHLSNILKRQFLRQTTLRNMHETPSSKKHCSRSGKNTHYDPVFINKSPSALRKDGRRSSSFRMKKGSKDESHRRRASFSVFDTEFGREVLLKSRAQSFRQHQGNVNSSSGTTLPKKQETQASSQLQETTMNKRKRKDTLAWKEFDLVTETTDNLKDRSNPLRKRNNETGLPCHVQVQNKPLKNHVHTHADAVFPRRHRCVIKSRCQKEEEEIMEMKRFRFHARPLNPKIYKRTKVSKVDGENQTTKSNKENTGKGAKNSSRKSGEPEVFTFKANPVPERILKGPIKIKPAVKFPSTCPRSPAFALRKRESPWKRLLQIMEEKEAQRKDEAAHKRSATHEPLASCPKLNPTRPVPFHFDEADKARQARKELKIKKILDEERMANIQMHEFRANPMPSPTPSELPEKHKIPLTDTVPFSLQVDKRGKKYQVQFEQQIMQEEEFSKNLVKFRANPCRVTTDKPFEVDPSSKPLTEFVDMKLATTARAARRALFDECLHEEELIRQEIIKQRLALEQEREEKELQVIRAEAVHKAQPMPDFKAPVIKPSTKPLTKPQSPNFVKR